MTRGFGEAKGARNSKSKFNAPAMAMTIEDAVSLMQGGDLLGAISTVERLIVQSPNNPRAYKILAGFELMNGNWQKAIEMSDAYLTHNPDDIEALYVIGIAQQESRNTPAAIDCYKKILAIRPSSADACNNLGVSMEQIGNLQEAIRYFRQGLEFSSNATDPCLITLNLAQALEYSHLLDEAAEVYSESQAQLDTDWNENSFTSLVSLLPVLLQLGEIERAKTVLRTALAIRKRFRVDDRIWRNKTHDLDYLYFLKRLLPLIPHQDSCLSADKSGQTRVLHIGDSHCLTFAKSSCTVNAKSYIIEPCLIKGAKAWHFANQERNRYKQSLDLAINQKAGLYDLVFISFGEIDCREHEGINTASEKSGLDPINVAAETAKAYVGYIDSEYGGLRNRLAVFGTPALSVARASRIKDGSQLNRMLDIIKTFNTSLSEASAERGIRFVDTYNLSLDSNGLNNQIWMLDKYHLNPSVLQVLMQDLCASWESACVNGSFRGSLSSPAG
jgi:tetratricopeptide (TPR) repeat protein